MFGSLLVENHCSKYCHLPAEERWLNCHLYFSTCKHCKCLVLDFFVCSLIYCKRSDVSVAFKLVCHKAYLDYRINTYILLTNQHSAGEMVIITSAAFTFRASLSWSDTHFRLGWHGSSSEIFFFQFRLAAYWTHDPDLTASCKVHNRASWWRYRNCIVFTHMSCSALPSCIWDTECLLLFP